MNERTNHWGIQSEPIWLNSVSKKGPLALVSWSKLDEIPDDGCMEIDLYFTRIVYDFETSYTGEEIEKITRRIIPFSGIMVKGMIDYGHDMPICTILGVPMVGTVFFARFATRDKSGFLSPDSWQVYAFSEDSLCTMIKSFGDER